MSILNSVKKLLGIIDTDTSFDTDLILHINSILMVLTQFGIGQVEGYSITGAENTWDEFIPEGMNLECIKTYVYLRVRLLFDPPDRSNVADSINAMVKEYEWRMLMELEGFTKES